MSDCNEVPMLHRTLHIWINMKLSRLKRGMITNIEELHDGWKLPILVHELSNEQFSMKGIKHTKNVKKRERNLQICLDFLEKELKLWVRNITANDLLWSTHALCDLLFLLVLYYDIEIPLFARNPYRLTKPDANTLLLEWVNENLPKDRTVKDFTDDWTNGINLAALLCCLSDMDLCDDWPTYSTDNGQAIWYLCTQLGTTHMDIPRMFPTSASCSGRLDEKCLMVYLSQFITARLMRENKLKKRPEFLQPQPISIEPEADYDSANLLSIRESLFMPSSSAEELRQTDDSVSFWDTVPDDMRKGLEGSMKQDTHLDIGESTIGEGIFGKVFHGRLRYPDKLGATNVAVKTLRDNSDKADALRFLNEATTMRNFDHKNVMKIIGFVVKNGKPCILLPYMENKDLRSYLVRHEQELQVRGAELLCEYCLQVARGMEYLAKLHFVHRDLAARNCLLDGDGVVKVGDFGFTRDILPGAYRMISVYAIPIAWIAPESIKTCLYTTESDVWSYGILLWEIFSYGAEPYDGIKDFFKFVLSGRRLRPPEHTPSELCELMSQCWNEEPQQRPSFNGIVMLMERCIATNWLGYDSVDHSAMATAHAAVVKRNVSKLSARPRMRIAMHGAGKDDTEVNTHVQCALGDIKAGRSGMEKEPDIDQLYDYTLLPPPLPKR